MRGATALDERFLVPQQLPMQPLRPPLDDRTSELDGEHVLRQLVIGFRKFPQARATDVQLQEALLSKGLIVAQW